MKARRFASLIVFIATAVLSSAMSKRLVTKPQEAFAPYWTAEPGWDTELQLKNNLPSTPLTVTPVLRLASGEEISLDAVTVLPNASTSVWVNQQLLKNSTRLLSQPGSYGSVAFRFTSFHSRNLHAASSLWLHGQPIGFTIPAFPAAASEAWPHAALAGSQEGIWWQPKPIANDLLIFSNSSERPLTGALWLSDASGNRWSQRMPLAAHQTIRLNMTQLLARAGLAGQYGGIRFEVPENAGALVSVHLIYDEVASSSSEMQMFALDPAETPQQHGGTGNKQWTAYAPMLALRNPDPTAGLPAGTMLQPTIFVRNVTGKNVSAVVTLSWNGASGNGQAKLPTLELAPFATQQLQIGAAQKQLGIPDDAHWALATVSTAEANEVIAVASSADATGKYSLPTEFSAYPAGHYAGGEWRVDTSHNQIISVTNSGQKPADTILTLHYGDGKKTYQMQQAVAPGGQMQVNVADLIRGRVPDSKGNVLPADVSIGTYDVQQLKAAGRGSLIEGSMALNGAYGFNARSQYANCCATPGAWWDPDSFDFGFGDPFTTAGIDGVDPCDNDPLDLTDDFDDWWSSNPAVAQVTTAKVTPEGEGTTTGWAEGLVMEGVGGYCAVEEVEVEAPITVFSFMANGKSYIFVGSDPNELYGNHYQLTDSTGTQNPQPPGGTCCADSSDASDVITQTGSNPPTFQFQTSDQSASVGDRTLTFEYDLSDGIGTAQQLSVTARQFAYAVNNSPSNACSGYGYSYTYLYTPYTHPDHASILPTDGLQRNLRNRDCDASVGRGHVY